MVWTGPVVLCTIRSRGFFLVSHGGSSYAVAKLAWYVHTVHADGYVTNLAAHYLLISSTRLLSGRHLNFPLDDFHARCIPLLPLSRLHMSVVQGPEGTAAREYQKKTWPNPLIFLLRKKIAVRVYPGFAMSAVLRYAACAKKLRGTNGLGVTKKILHCWICPTAAWCGVYAWQCTMCLTVASAPNLRLTFWMGATAQLHWCRPSTEAPADAYFDHFVEEEYRQRGRGDCKQEVTGCRVV